MRRTRWAAVAAAAVLVLGVSTACGGSSGGAAEADVPAALLAAAPVATAADIPPGSPMDRIRKRGYLIVGGATGNVTFGLLNPITNRRAGFDVNIASMLAKYIVGKPKVQLVLESSKTREPLLNNHTVDVLIATYTVTPARAEQVTFAGPYFTSGSSILIRKSSPVLHKASDLNGKTICAEESSSNVLSVAEAAPKAHLLLFDSHAECLQAVQEGRAYGFANDYGTLLGDVARHDDVQIGLAPYDAASYGIGLAKGQQQFARFIDDWLVRIERGGQWAQAYRASLGQTKGVGSRPPAIGSVPGTVGYKPS